MGIIDTQQIAAEVVGLPVFVVDTVVRRDLGNGIASIVNCRRQNGVIIPMCEIIVGAKNLLTICKGANDFALEMHHRMQMERLHALRMDGTAH